MKLLPSFTGRPEVNKIYHTEFFTLCGAMADNSVDMILCDLPYGTTACEWDNRIPLEPMWAQFKRIIKPNGAIVLTASQPFTSMLVMSNLDWFRDEWIWHKSQATRFLDANRRPMKNHESVIVFGESLPNYYPQMIEGKPYKANRSGSVGYIFDTSYLRLTGINEGFRHPKTILYFLVDFGRHPTQKPVDLFEYLVKTYTLPDQLVFDPCVGSGTTAVAAKNTGRNYICGDYLLEYVEIARKRVNPVFGDPPKRKREVLPMTSLPLFEAISQ